MGRLRLLVIRDRWIVQELLCEDMWLGNDIREREREGMHVCTYIETCSTNRIHDNSRQT